MYSGIWTSKFYKNHINHGKIDIDTKKGNICFIYTGTHNNGKVVYYNFDPQDLDEKVLHLDTYFWISIQNYTLHTIMGTYQTWGPHDHGIFIAYKEYKRCCNLT